MFQSIQLIALIATIIIGLSSCRQVNQAGLNLIKEFEGFRANFYNDPVGIKTIGYGHACHANDCNKIKPPLSQAQGEQLLRSDLAKYESCVTSNAPGLNDNQFAAVVSFTYNLGCGSLQKSTLLKYLKAKNTKAGANEFSKWNKAGGNVLAGLTRRRASERQLFCSSGGC